MEIYQNVFINHAYIVEQSSRAVKANRTISENIGITTQSLLGGFVLLVGVVAVDGVVTVFRLSIVLFDDGVVPLQLVVIVCLLHRSPQPSACRCIQSNC